MLRGQLEQKVGPSVSRGTSPILCSEGEELVPTSADPFSA